MQTQIPHFKRRAGGGADKYFEMIEMNGERIHKIENLGAFYEAFGYTPDTAKTGILPDEFIWDEYIKNAALAYTECLQIHIIEYLREHCGTFMKMYREQSESWIASHAETIASRGILCPACRMKPFCSKRKVF